MKQVILLLFWALIAHTLLAQETERPVTSVLKTSFGQAQVRNARLTPLLYTGQNWGIGYERWRLQQNLRWVNLQWADVDFSAMTDVGERGETWSGRLRYRYAVMRQLGFGSSHRAQGWNWYVGPYGGTDVGFDYNLKMASANNPATVRLTANLGASAAIRYTFAQPRFEGLSFLLQAQAPLVGLGLMPDYGASYYETFYLGTNSDIMHITSLHNQQDLDLRLTADVPVWLIPWFSSFDATLRVGVNWHIETMDINQTTTRYSALEFVIGWVYQYLPYHRKRQYKSHVK